MENNKLQKKYLGEIMMLNVLAKLSALFFFIPRCRKRYYFQFNVLTNSDYLIPSLLLSHCWQ